jgi:hypothetical protein
MPLEVHMGEQEKCFYRKAFERKVCSIKNTKIKKKENKT